jgi:hypothetical protein
MSYYNNHWYEQTLVHEVQGSVKKAEREEDPHNHRFATVTGEATANSPTTTIGTGLLTITKLNIICI